MRNTYFNSKPIEFSVKEQFKSPKRRLQWGEVTVISNKLTSTSTVQMNSTMTRFKDQRDKKPIETKKPKSILKGFEDPLQEENEKTEERMLATDSFPQKKDNNFISAINGNIVHVTVNNFITTDKKPT